MNEETVVVQNGVTVRKSFSADDFPVPAVTFAVASTREEPVELRITDSIPEGFGVEQIGFHPDYGSEYWTATGEGGVRFERPVDPGEEFTTVYGVRMNADDEPTVFLEKPSVEVNPAEAAETADVVPEESSEVVRELARGERASVPGLEGSGEAEAESSEVEATATGPGPDEGDPEPSEDVATATGPGSDEPEPEPDEAVATATGPGSDEHEPEPDESVATATGPDSDEPESESSEADEAAETGLDREARSTSPDEPIPDANQVSTEEATGDVESVGGDVSDLESEPDPGEASESELGETGPDREESEVIGDTVPVDTSAESAGPETTEPAVETPAEGDGTTPDETAGKNEATTRSMPPESDTESVVAAFADEIESGSIDDAHLSVIREALHEERPSDQVRLEHLQSRVSDLEAYTDALERFLDEEGGGAAVLDDLEAEIGSFEAELTDIGGRLDAAAAERDTMSEHLENLENTVEALAGVAEQIERVHDDVEALDERLADVEAVGGDVSDLEAELESVRTDLDEITEWRDQLSDVFGP